MAERDACIAYLERRAAAIEAERAAERVQAHSRRLPTETELAEAAFAVRQLRAVADDLRAGLHIADVAEPEGAAA